MSERASITQKRKNNPKPLQEDVASGEFISTSLLGIQPKRMNANQIVRLQRTIGNQAVQKILGSQSLSNVSIQRTFGNADIDTVLGHYSPDDNDHDFTDRDTGCNSTSDRIYAALGNYPAGQGRGMDSLTNELRKMSNKSRKIVYRVDGNLFGHVFSILQQGQRTRIIQGYLNVFTIDAWRNSAKSSERPAADLQHDLNRLFQLLQRVRSERDFTSDIVTQFGQIHEELFGLGTDRETLRGLFQRVKANIGRDLLWEASFVDAPSNRCSIQ